MSQREKTREHGAPWVKKGTPCFFVCPEFDRRCIMLEEEDTGRAYYGSLSGIQGVMLFLAGTKPLFHIQDAGLCGNLRSFAFCYRKLIIRGEREMKLRTVLIAFFCFVLLGRVIN